MNELELLGWMMRAVVYGFFFVAIPLVLFFVGIPEWRELSRKGKKK